MADFVVRVEGLDEALKALRPTDIPKTYRKETRQVVNRTVLPAARRGLGNLSHVPFAKGAVSTYATSTATGLQINRGRYPWVAGAEFGSHAYRQFLPWVGNQYTGAGNFPGYFVGPAIKANLATFEKELLDALERLFLQ